MNLLKEDSPNRIKPQSSGRLRQYQLSVRLSKMPRQEPLTNVTRQIDSNLLRPIVKFLKQMLDSQMVNTIRWVDTEVCVADIMNKPARRLLTAKVMEIIKTGKMIDLACTNKKSKLAQISN